MKKIIMIFTTALMLSSCGLYTKYESQTEVPENLYGEVLSSSRDTTTIAQLSWKELFQDAELQSLIETALASNTNLLTAQLKVEEAEAALTSARLSYLPSLSLQPTGTIAGLLEQGGKPSQTYTLPAVASWEVDIFGRIRNNKERAKMAYSQSQDYEQAVKTQLVASVANIYYTLLMLDAQVAITTATEQSWSESLKSAESMKRAGMMNEAGVAQIRAAYLATQSGLIELKSQLVKTENAMCLILASTPKAIKRGAIESQKFPSYIAIGVPVQMLSLRPDVRMAEATLAQSFYATNIARSAFYPSVVLSGSVGWTNVISDIVINPAETIYSLVGSLTQPIFNKGMNRAQLKIAKAQHEEAKLAFQQTLLAAGGEVNDAMISYQAAIAKSSLYTDQVKALEVARNSTALTMKHGTTTYLEVLTAEQTLLSARLQDVANRTSEIQSLIALYSALGGGTF